MANSTLTHMMIGFWVLVGLNAAAQSWTNRYDGPVNGEDRVWAMAVDGSGNVYVTGSSTGTGSDYATIKYSSSGLPLWTNRYNGPVNGGDEASAIGVDGSGNVYVTGSSTGSGTGSDYATIKYSSAGVPLWTNRYNGPANNYDAASAIAVDSSGIVHVTGSSFGSTGWDSSDYVTIAYSSAGVPLWTNRYNGPTNAIDSANAIAVDGSGNVYVTGGSGPRAGNTVRPDYLTVAYSGAGAPLWTNRYDRALAAHAIVVDSTGNVYVAGSGYTTLAYSSAGVPLWTNRYGDGNAEAVAVDGTGNVYVTGFSGNHFDAVTIKYSSAGVPLWTNRYDSPVRDNDGASAIAVDDSGNVYVAGSSTRRDCKGCVSATDFLTIAYTSSGMPLWVRLYNGLGDNWDYATAIAVDDSGNVYVAGWSIGNGTSYDYATVKYAPPIVDHFTWNTIQSSQIVDVPFPVTLTAEYLCGATVTSFTGNATLSGHVPTNPPLQVSIGTGTNSWGFPLNSRYHDARTTVIYGGGPIGRACTLNSLALDVVTPPGQTLENWTIRIKQTGSGWYTPPGAIPQWESSGWTVVYQGNAPAGGSGWRIFEFSTPFEYSGVRNLMVDFSFNNDSYSSDGLCRFTPSYYPGSITYASDSLDGDPLTWSGSNPTPVLSYNMPNIVWGVKSLDRFPGSIIPTETGPFVNGVWNGMVTVHEAVSNLVLRADDGLSYEGESNPFDVLAPPTTITLVLPEDPFSFTNGCYGFMVQGSAGQVVVVEASTNLTDWLSIHTNLMGDLGEFLFYDLHTGQYPRRYYRAKLHDGPLPPAMMLSSGSEVVGAQFRVAVGAVGGQEVIVEATTNLLDWTPILTNTAAVGPLYFHDPDMTNFTKRFYRAVTR